MAVTEFDWPADLGGGGPGSGGLPTLRWTLPDISWAHVPGVPSMPTQVSEFAEWYRDHVVHMLSFQLRVGATVAGAVVIVIGYGLAQARRIDFGLMPNITDMLPSFSSTIMSENMWIGPGAVFYVR